MKINTKKYWVADTGSDFKDNKVYEVEGFEIMFQKDKYYSAEKTVLVFDKKKNLRPIFNHDEDFKIFDNQTEAIEHKNKREKHWLDWFKKQAKEYQEKVDSFYK